MGAAAAEPQDYLIARIHEALVQDPEVAEPTIEVAMRGDTVILKGKVPSHQRRDAIVQLVAQVAAGRRIDDQTEIVEPTEPEESEELG